MKKIWSASFRRRLFWAFLAAAMIPLLLCAGSLLQIFRLRLTDAARTEAQAHLNSALYAVESAYDGFHRAAEHLAGDDVVMAAWPGGRQTAPRCITACFRRCGRCAAMPASTCTTARAAGATPPRPSPPSAPCR